MSRLDQKLVDELAEASMLICAVVAGALLLGFAGAALAIAFYRPVCTFLVKPSAK